MFLYLLDFQLPYPNTVNPFSEVKRWLVKSGLVKSKVLSKSSSLVKIFPRSRRDLGRDRGRDLGAFLAAEIFISPRSRSRSRRDRGRDLGAFLAAESFYRAAISAEISPLISARFWPPRFSSRRDLGQKRAEISGEISAR